MRSPETIARHAQIWIRYGVISPLIFITFSWVSYFLELVSVDALTILGVTIATTTCFVWWFWALKVIMDMSSFNTSATKGLTDIKELIIMTNKELVEQRDLYDILKTEIENNKKSTRKSKKT